MSSSILEQQQQLFIPEKMNASLFPIPIVLLLIFFLSAILQLIDTKRIRTYAIHVDDDK